MITFNITPATVPTLAIDTYAATRKVLLSNAEAAVDGAETSVTTWARAELIAQRSGLTTREATQRAVIEKFPSITPNGKVSATPNGKFRTHWNRYCLVADVLSGISKTYLRPEALAMAVAFLLDTSKQSLFDLEQSIKADHNAANKAVRDAVPEQDKEKAKAKADAEGRAVVAGIMMNDARAILALADRMAKTPAKEMDGQPMQKALARLQVALVDASARIAAHVASRVPEAKAA